MNGRPLERDCPIIDIFTVGGKLVKRKLEKINNPYSHPINHSHQTEFVANLVEDLVVN